MMSCDDGDFLSKWDGVFVSEIDWTKAEYKQWDIRKLRMNDRQRNEWLRNGQSMISCIIYKNRCIFYILLTSLIVNVYISGIR